MKFVHFFKSPVDDCYVPWLVLSQYMISFYQLSDYLYGNYYLFDLNAYYFILPLEPTLNEDVVSSLLKTTFRMQNLWNSWIYEI